MLLFQNMFPVAECYIENLYIKGGQVVRIANPKTISDLQKNAHKVMSLLRRGIKFTPTQPDAMRIEKLMSELTECDCKEQRI